MTPPFHDVAFDVSGRVARLEIARPDKLNALRDETAGEILAALRIVEARAEVRSLVITGRGRAFGAGYDLSVPPPTMPPELGDVLERHFNPLIAAMRASRLPIVAAVNGPCAGASVGLALASDIVIAAEDAYFYEPFVGLALVPDAGNTVFLTRLLGRGRAAAMMLLGERISATEARDWGLVWRTCAPADLEATVAAIAERLAGLPPAAIAATKRLIGEAAEADLADRLAAERDAQAIAGRGPEVLDRIERFFRARRG